MRGPGWGVMWGRFWMVQWALRGGFSLGIHVDPFRRHADAGAYGPFLDLHVGPLVLSLGNHPARANGLVALYGQGGVMRPG